VCDDGYMCDYAAAIGHPEVLKWAREQGCVWDDQTLQAAARRGHLEVLRWARKHGCPWDAATRSLAATKGYSDNFTLS